MACSDCHRPSSDREHFEPITMEGMCRSCHTLAFDEEEPDRQLPHADVRSAVVALEEHYVRRFADPQQVLVDARRQRRRPARLPEVRTCAGTALQCGRERAALEAFNQFTRSGCITCHEVSEDPRRSVYERWIVLPVRLVADWFPMARFDHLTHLTRRDSRAEEDATCRHCHAADVSKLSQDVLMPGLDTCLGCHGEHRGQQAVVLACTDCHGFHLPGGTPMRAAFTTTPTGAGSDPP
jgi:hypothetical protein